MMDVTTEEQLTSGKPDAVPSAIALDPFSYFARRRSVLGTMGGDDSQSDPSYAFHTHYISAPLGTVDFTVRVVDLSATCGTLNLRVHAIPADHSSEAKVVKSAPVPLTRLAEAGGEVMLRFISKPDRLYAVVASVHDETDATASDVAIWFARADDGSVAAEDLMDTRCSEYGSGTTADTPHLLSRRMPTLEWPASQLCTDRQLTEPAFRKALAKLGETPAANRAQWERAFILQSLERYGMMRPGGTALALSHGDDALPAYAAAADCTVVRALPGSRSPDAAMAEMARPAICADEMFRENVSTVVTELTSLPPAIRGFDFLWSSDAIRSCGSIADANEFVLRTTLRLASGGVAVHIFDLRIDENDEIGPGELQLVLRRRHLERLAFYLLAAGHDVATIRYAGARFGAHGKKPDPISTSTRAVERFLGMRVTSFGLVIRRNLA